MYNPKGPTFNLIIFEIQDQFKNYFVFNNFRKKMSIFLHIFKRQNKPYSNFGDLDGHKHTEVWTE